MNDTEFVDLEVDLTRFHFLNGFAHLHRNRTGLGVRHQAAGTQNTAQRTYLAHYVRRADRGQRERGAEHDSQTETGCCERFLCEEYLSLDHDESRLAD